MRLLAGVGYCDLGTTVVCVAKVGFNHFTNLLHIKVLILYSNSQHHEIMRKLLFCFRYVLINNNASNGLPALNCNKYVLERSDCCWQEVVSVDLQMTLQSR